MDILIPTDFSEYADHALNLAVELAHKHPETKLRLLHIVEAPGTSGFNAMGEVIMDDQSNNLYFIHRLNEAKRLIEELQREVSAKGVAMEMEIAIGNTYQNISKVIAEKKVDLVIMGTRGVGGLDEILIGSNTERVVRHAKVPVITVKSALSLDSLKRVAVASDFVQTEDKLLRQIHLLKDIADPQIDLLYVNTPARFKTTWEMENVMSKFADQVNSSKVSIHIINDHIEEEAINRYVEVNKVDMVIIGTAGRKGLLHLLTGSIAEDIVNHCKAAVWVFPLR
jgi:nucleotide-binding universal stress UspA family protein